MAGFNVVGKLAEAKLPKLGKKDGTPEKGNTVGSLKKQINELMKEKSTLFGVIGMEAYDLYVAKKLECPELALYLEKMDAVAKQISSLEEEKKQLEMKAQKNNICECGCKLSKNDKFCPSCGKRVDNGMILCTCGTEVDSKVKFCPNCGTMIESLKETSDSPVKEETLQKECICGAKIMPGQFMCMECGRRVDAQ